MNAAPENGHGNNNVEMQCSYTLGMWYCEVSHNASGFIFGVLPPITIRLL